MFVYYVVRRHPRYRTPERISEFAVSSRLAIAHMAPGFEVQTGDKVEGREVKGSIRYIDEQGYAQYQRSEDPVKSRRRRKYKRNCGPCRMNPRRSRRAKVSARRIKRYVKGRRSVTISTRRLKRRGRRWIAIQRRRARGKSPYMSMIERKYSKRKNPQIQKFTQGGFVLHKITGNFKGNVSAWYDRNGTPIDAIITSRPFGGSRQVKRGGPIWNQVKVMGNRYKSIPAP
jgi:hypothetical protein